jgi:hypothetical protein
MRKWYPMSRADLRESAAMPENQWLSNDDCGTHALLLHGGEGRLEVRSSVYFYSLQRNIIAARSEFDSWAVGEGCREVRINFAAISGDASTVSPVMFPPGRPRLMIRPACTGSLAEIYRKIDEFAGHLLKAVEFSIGESMLEA